MSRSLCLASVAVLAFNAVAAEPGAPIDNIIITGSRVPIAYDRAPASVTVIQRDVIESRQALFVSDLLREVPGIAVSRSGGSGAFTQLRMRGAEGNHVMVLLDGIEINDPANGDELDLGSFSTTEIERIEIIRGPQSALWGSDALAGVINIVTRKAAQGYHAELELEGGTFATNRQRASFAAATERYRMRAAVSRLDTGGINIARVGDEQDAFHGVTLDLNGGLQVRDNFALSFVLRTDNSETQTDSGAITGLPVDTPGLGDNHRTYLGTRADLDLYDGRWQHRVDLNWSSSDNENFDPAVFQQSDTAADRYELSYQTTVAFTLPIPIASAQRATFALDYEMQEFKQRGPVTFFGDPNQDRSLDNKGYVGIYEVDVVDGLSVGGSVRFDDNSDFRNVTSYRGSANWRLPITGTMLSVAYATGQKSPTFTERFGFASGGLFGPVFIGNGDLKPEKARGWDLGLTQAFLDDALNLRVSWFRDRLRDEINGFVVDATGATATAVNLGGTSRRQGVEFSLAAEVAFGIGVRAGYAYLDANEIDRASGRRKDEVRRPNHQANLALDWSSPDRRLRLSSFATYTGTTDDIVFLAPLYQSQRVRLGSYTVVGASARYRVSTNLEVFGRVENAFDEHYEEVFGFSAPGLGGYGGIRLTFDIE